MRVLTYRCEHTVIFRDEDEGVDRRITGAVVTVRGSYDAVRWAMERVRVVAEQLMKTPAQVDAYVSDLLTAYPVPPEQALAEGGALDLEVTDPSGGAIHEITVLLPVDVPAPVRLPRRGAVA